MPLSSDFLSAAIYVPRRNALLTKDVEEAFQQLAASGFSFDPRGHLRVVNERRIPQVTGDRPGGRTLEGALSADLAVGQLRRISADNWGQIMVRGTFAIGGAFEEVTAVVCPLATDSPSLFSAHLLFRQPGLLVADRPADRRVGHAMEALDRLQDAFAPVLAFLDTQQPEVEARSIRMGRLPWLPWAGYLSPGALHALAGGAFEKLPDWLQWLEGTLKAKGTSGARRTRGGGLLWVLPDPQLGRGAHGPAPHTNLGPWIEFVGRGIA
jgi:hypothetical protein